MGNTESVAEVAKRARENVGAEEARGAEHAEGPAWTPSQVRKVWSDPVLESFANFSGHSLKEIAFAPVDAHELERLLERYKSAQLLPKEEDRIREKREACRDLDALLEPEEGAR